MYTCIDTYVYMQDIYVYMQDNYVYMQDIYVYMQDDYVYMQDNYVYIIFFHISQNLCSAMKNLCNDVPSGPPYVNAYVCTFLGNKISIKTCLFHSSNCCPFYGEYMFGKTFRSNCVRIVPSCQSILAFKFTSPKVLTTWVYRIVSIKVQFMEHITI